MARKTKKIDKTQRIVDDLVEAAEQLGYHVRLERGNFRGGRCTVDDDEMIMLNRRHTAEVHLAILAESLRDLPVDTVYLRPVTRAALEDAWARADRIETELSEEEG